MEKEEVLKNTSEYVKKEMSGDSSGHDWWHVQRVWKNSVLIGEKERADMFIVQMAALLHDLEDWKFDEEGAETLKRTRNWMEGQEMKKEEIEHISEIIKSMSFKGAGVKSEMKTNEGKIVQDADRLDAMGAIGVARCFAYGGSKSKEIYNPEMKAEKHETFEDYKKKSNNSVNHFHEKLLLLKDLMNTESAKKIAEERHKFMENFLEQFYSEWEGKK